MLRLLIVASDHRGMKGHRASVAALLPIRIFEGLTRLAEVTSRRLRGPPPIPIPSTLHCHLSWNQTLKTRIFTFSGTFREKQKVTLHAQGKAQKKMQDIKFTPQPDPYRESTKLNKTKTIIKNSKPCGRENLISRVTT